MKRTAQKDSNNNQQSSSKKQKEDHKDMEGQVSLNEAKEQFNKLMRSLSKKDLEKFQNYVHEKVHPHEHHHEEEHNDNNNTQLSKAEKIRKTKLDIIKGAIIPELRKLVPVDGQAPDETIYIPKNEEYKEYSEENTIHVDQFLYENDEDIDELEEAGLLSRVYCKKCKSREIGNLNFVSHSASLNQLEFIFSDSVLGNLEGKTVVDIGSRLGAVLFVGFIFSKAKELIGIEKSKFFCETQEHIINLIKMNKRVKVIHDDITNQKELISNADVVIMNNVFEFFMPQEAQNAIWDFVRSAVTKKGALLVTLPSLENQLEAANVCLISFFR